MNVLQRSGRSLRELIDIESSPPTRFLADENTHLRLQDLVGMTSIDHPSAGLHGRTVMIRTGRQLPAALALAELDGVAGRIILATPDLDAAHLPAIQADIGIDLMLSDSATLRADMLQLGVPAACCGTPRPQAPADLAAIDTEWVLFTSGTTGRPKMVQHSLAALLGPAADRPAGAETPVWSTFYDIRRYGGLQILLRALVGGGSMVLSDQAGQSGAFLDRARASGVTHISGTPSHWRRLLMSPSAGMLQPRYVRLSGEVADQPILDSLAQAYPDAAISHAFASTEAGVVFDVQDGLSGFPADFIGVGASGVECRADHGSLQVRSSRTATRYLGRNMAALRDADGFVETGDMIELRHGRYQFAGRREGVINVGGLKVYPEEVEAVINTHPGVRMSRVWSRPNPITGAIVSASIVRRPDSIEASRPFPVMREEILADCRARLAPHKVPASLREVPELAISASGKLARLDA